MARKRAFNEGKRHFKQNKKQRADTFAAGSNEEVLLADVKELLQGSQRPQSTVNAQSLPDLHSETDLRVVALSSTGDGLAEKDGQVYVVPFTVPGDAVHARVYKHFITERYTLTDLVAVSQPSPDRIQNPKCQYFAQCSGCQFQELSYTYQLSHKKRVLEKAYRNFSGLPASLVPQVGDTIGSPLQYGYRTKLTPHFDGPPGQRKAGRKGERAKWTTIPEIGFMKKGTRKTLDIEDCPIGTEAVRTGLSRERERVRTRIEDYARGATLLLRESTERIAPSSNSEAIATPGPIHGPYSVNEDQDKHLHQKICITDHTATSTEYVDNYRFDNPAGAFFQNNNSILPLVTQYLRDNILGRPSHQDDVSDAAANNLAGQKITNMIDAYCGSGFFTIALSSIFRRSIGIDISPQSIEYATRNAAINGLPRDSANFISSDANALFSPENLDHTRFPPAETVVIIDPPRKGCDKSFVRQLMAYGPERICYVSCNVHTQARDVGWLVGGLGLVNDGETPSPTQKFSRYEIESLRGFDFFPQTSHVEGIAILRRKSDDN